MKIEKGTNSRTVRPVFVLLLLLSVAGVLLPTLLRAMCSWYGMTDREREEATRRMEAKEQNLRLKLAEIHSLSPVDDALASLAVARTDNPATNAPAASEAHAENAENEEN